MACGIILSGASSIGKSTLAHDWCKKHKDYTRIEEIARDIMRSLKLTRDDLTASIETKDKKVFLDLQLRILDEQSRMEESLKGKAFISDRGPDPLVYALHHAGQEAADRLCRHPAAAACLERYRTDLLVVILCPLPVAIDDGFRMLPTDRTDQERFNNLLRQLLDRHRVPYFDMNVVDRERRIRTLENLTKSTLDTKVEMAVKLRPLSLAFHPKAPRTTSLCRVDITCESIKISSWSFQDGKTNRMVNRYGTDNLIVVSFDRKVSSAVIKDVLHPGVWINGKNFNFLGCSSSGLKSRTCYMYQGSTEDVERVLGECLAIDKKMSVSKKMKRIGMLFSEVSLTSVTVYNENAIERDDIEKDGFIFTDGCGGISKHLAQQIVENMGIVESYLPSVYQIRYQGCKGVVVIDHLLDKGKLMIRPSMKKCISGTMPFFEIGLCDYSHPYSYGHLNRQFIMLFSALGVSDEVFLRKQEDFFVMVEKMTEEPEVAIQMLHWKNMPDVARKVVANGGNLKEPGLKREVESLRNKIIEKLEKLHIMVPESRCIFGVCDPLSILSYGQCFVRPIIAGKLTTVCGLVAVAKNPCYLLGDIRVLQAVDDHRLHHLVDCIVFPTQGKRPHPVEMAGSDLDGDQYFVSWDNDFVVIKLHEPYDYPETANTAPDPPMIDYFAELQSSMGIIDNYYKFWADHSGVQSEQCQALGKLFSRSVDATKTGDQVRIPDPFKPPKGKFETWKDNSSVSSSKNPYVWQKLDQNAREFHQKMKNAMISASVEAKVPTPVSETFVWQTLNDEQRTISEYQLFLFIEQWIQAQQLSHEESLDRLIEFSRFIDFGKFTVDEQKAAVDKGIPLHIVTNALNSSQLLTQTMLKHFNLDTPQVGWHYYMHSMGADMDWKLLVHAVVNYPESLLVLQVLDEAFLGLHFLSSLKEGDMIPLIPGLIVTYLFSPQFEYYERHILDGSYYVSLDDKVMQIYRNKQKSQSFLWLANEVTKKGGLSHVMFDRISVDLTRFKGARPKHPLINKQQVSSFEVFVKAENQGDAYLDFITTMPPDFKVSKENLSSLDIEEIPEDELKTLDCHVTPHLTVQNIQEVLEVSSIVGNVSIFRAATELLLSFEGKLDDTIFDKFSTLLEALISKYIHLPSLPGDLVEILQVLLSTLLEHQCYKSALRSVQTVSQLDRLHCHDLVKQFLPSFLASMQLSKFSEYIECVRKWENWCFLSKDVAYQLSFTIYTLARSLINVESTNSPCLPISQLAASFQNVSTPNLSSVMSYILHFSFLALRSFISDVCDYDKDGLSTLKAIQTSSCASVEDEKQEEPGLVCFVGDTRASTAVFKPGAYVRVMTMSRTAEPVCVTIGCVTQLSWSPTSVSVNILKPMPLCLECSVRLNKGHWKLELLGNVTLFHRQMKALSALLEGTQCCGISSILVHSDGLPFLHDHQSALKPELHPSETSQSSVDCDPSSDEAQFSNKEFHCHTANIFICNDQTSTNSTQSDSHFNLSQENAIKASLSKILTLIQGPPGTGKTHVACRIIQLKCEQHSAEKKYQVLAVAETNLAVDNLTLHLHRLGLRVVRLGSEAKVSSAVRQFTLEYQVDLKRKAQGKKPSLFPSPKAAREVLHAAQVITTTCTGAGDPILDEMEFPFVVIDEATQATEPTMLIPLVHHCQQVTLIGDPQQLAPTVISYDCEQVKPFGRYSIPDVSLLKTTLFHRLQRIIPIQFLDEQYRMVPGLCEFPSQSFYDGKLKCAAQCQKYKPIEFEWPDKKRPLVFINVDGHESFNNASLMNAQEADTVVAVVNCLMKFQVSPLEVAVLTPYRAQVEHMLMKLKSVVAGVEVCTIDSFQGREKEVIIFSTVRCNENGDLRFVQDRYRMNVLLT